MSTPEASLAENIYIFQDNEAATVTLAEEYKEPSCFEHTINLASQENVILGTRGTHWPKNVGGIDFRWCPGYVGIERNEKADTLAKEVCETEKSPDIPDTTKHALTKIEERYMRA